MVWDWTRIAGEGPWRVEFKAPLQHLWKETARTHGGFCSLDATPVISCDLHDLYDSTWAGFYPYPGMDQVPRLFTTLRTEIARSKSKSWRKSLTCAPSVLSLVSVVNVDVGLVTRARCFRRFRGMMPMDQLLSTTLSSRRNVFDSGIIAGLFAIFINFQAIANALHPIVRVCQSWDLGTGAVCEGLMQVLGFSSTTREDLILKLLSYRSIASKCAFAFCIDPIDLAWLVVCVFLFFHTLW